MFLIQFSEFLGYKKRASTNNFNGYTIAVTTIESSAMI
jgi:hypothetical protein